jgi:hypothetical protein
MGLTTMGGVFKVRSVDWNPQYHYDPKFPPLAKPIELRRIGSDAFGPSAC